MLDYIRGTDITASIPIRQHVFDELLAAKTTIATVAFQDGDVLIANVFGIAVKARIVRVEPQARVVLGVSFLVRLALRPLKSRLPFVAIIGDEVVVDVKQAVIRTAPEYARVMEHVRIVQLRSSNGMLNAVVKFEVE